MKCREAASPEEGVLPDGPASHDDGAVADTIADGPLMIAASSATYHQLDILHADSVPTYIRKLVLQENS